MNPALADWHTSESDGNVLEQLGMQTFRLTHRVVVKVLVCCRCGLGSNPSHMQQLTGTEAGTLSGLLSNGTYVLDFRLNGMLCAGITRPECRQFKCMELTKT